MKHVASDSVKSRLFAFVVLLFVCGLDIHAGLLLRGRVTDTSGDDVFAANVFLVPTLRVATATDLSGQFELPVPDGSIKDTLVVSFVGYVTEFIPLSGLDTGAVTVVLREDNRFLSAVIVESQPEASREFSSEKLERMDIYLSPAANGDALNAITFLPASTNTDESANPAFRGSYACTSQVLLNGMPIADPVRNTEINGMGNFCLFNTSLIDNLTVYAGNPPLSKSNATSGVTDIRTANRIDRSHTECSLSLASIGLLCSQKLETQGNCFLQGYTNWQFHGPYTAINNASGLIESFRSNDVGLNIHFSSKKAGRGKMDANLYSYYIDESFKGASYMDNARTGTQSANRRGFAVADIRGIDGRLAYDISLGVDMSNGSHVTDSARANFIDGQEADSRFHLNAILRHYLNSRLWIESGISADYSKTDIKCIRPVNPYDRSDIAQKLCTDTTLKQFTPELFLYVRYEVADGLILGGGVRGDLSGTVCQNSCGNTLSWQANVRYTSGNHSLLFSGGMYHGHIAPTLFIPAFTSTKSFQANLEYRYHNSGTHVEASLYGKRDCGTEYISHLCQALEDERHIAGMEVSAKQDFGHLRIGLSYTCLLSVTILDGKKHESANNLPWWVKGSLQYAADDGFTFSLSGQIRPGTRYTPIIKGYWDKYSQQYFPVFGEYNSARLGNYCRLDMSLNKVMAIGQRTQGILFATLTNIFNRKNEAGPVYLSDYSMCAGYFYFQPYTVYFGMQVVF